MAGKSQKHPASLQGHRPQRQMITLAPQTNTAPTAPSGLLPSAEHAWDAFWRSGVSQIVDRDADMDALEDWIWLVSERDRLRPLVQAEPLVLGSMGQMVENPLSKTIDRYSKRIERYREQFGM